MKTSTLRAALLAIVAPLAIGAVMLSTPLPAAAGALTSPTTMDDCKGDGWQHFLDPIFKNQGECVSYVNHLGDGSTGVDPAATPELGSLTLFASATVGVAGYAAAQLRTRRRRQA